MKEEFYALAFHKTLYESLEQLQRDLDAYVALQPRARTKVIAPEAAHRTQAFLEGVEKLRREEVKPEAA